MRRAMFGLVCMSMMMAISAGAAVSGDSVELVGSTVPGQPAHTAGQFDVTVPGTLVFHSEGKPDLVMPYDNVFEFGLKREDAFHLVFFPAMFFGMVAPRPQRHVFTVSWHNTDGTGEEATFEVSRAFSEHLIPVMYARARKVCVRTEYGACTPVVPPPPPPRTPLMAP